MEHDMRYSKCYSELANRFPNSIIEWDDTRQVWQALTSRQAMKQEMMFIEDEDDEDEEHDFYW